MVPIVLVIGRVCSFIREWEGVCDSSCLVRCLIHLQVPSLGARASPKLSEPRRLAGLTIHQGLVSTKPSGIPFANKFPRLRDPSHPDPESASV